MRQYFISVRNLPGEIEVFGDRVQQVNDFIQVSLQDETVCLVNRHEVLSVTSTEVFEEDSEENEE